MRPALEVLRELDDTKFMDKLALHLHDGTQAVRQFGRPAKITISIEIAPLTKQGLTEPVITMESDISSKLPKPEAHKALFFIDENGEATTKQTRQREIGFSVAGAEQENVANG
jgi:hypothetical protein